jgi:hypothetical protein
VYYKNQTLLVNPLVRGVVVYRRSIEELLGVQMFDLIKVIHLTYSKTHQLDGARGDTLPIDDLNIHSLTSIGKLSIKWTNILEDHLKLDLLEMTLSVMCDYLSIDFESPIYYWQRR